MAPPEAAADRCDVVIYRAHTGTTQTFPLSSGGVLRIGRGMANDVVLDFNGVSVYHCELYLRPSADPSQAGKQLLCIRDSSKNGTGVRPGPHAAVAEGAEPNPPWEPLKRDVLRVLEHGWQLMVPLRSRKESLQLPEAWRTISVYVGSKPAGLAGGEELDGEAWEPIVSKVVAPAFGLPPPPPPPDLGGGAFEEAPPPPPERLAARAAGSDDEAERGRAERKKKKEKKARKREAEREAQSGSDEDEEQRERKKRQKEKKARKPARDESDEEPEDKREKKKKQKAHKRKAGEPETPTEPARATQLDRKKREEREERERLERELEDELAEELTRKARGKTRGDDEDDGISIHTGFTSHAPPKRPAAKPAKKAAGGDDSDAEEDDDLKSAWSRALADSEAGKARGAGDTASDRLSTAAVASAPGATPATPAMPAVVEVVGSEKAAGIYLRCGANCGQSMYQRLKDEEVPIFLYYWDGNGDESCAGWYAATSPTGKQGHDDYLDFWKSPSVLPATGTGECGGRMEARSQLDGPTLAALAQLPEATRRSVRAAFTAAGASAPKGVLEDESSEAVGDVGSESGQGGAEASPLPASESSLPPWKRRRGLRQEAQEAADRKMEEGASEPEATAAGEPEATMAKVEASAGEAPAEAESSRAATGEAAPLLVKGEESTASVTAAAAEMRARAGAAVEIEIAKAEGSTAPPEAPAQEAAGAGEAAAEAAPAEAEVRELKPLLAKAEETGGQPQPEARPEEPASAAAGEPPKSPKSVAATDGTNLDLAGATEAGEATEPAGPEAVPVGDEGAPTEAERRAAAEQSGPDGDDVASERSNLTTTAPQKTVPGDRGESQAPTIPPADQLRGESEGPFDAVPKAGKRGAGLTKEALAAHTAALARAQAEAYAATFASARSHYSKSHPGRSVAGRSLVAGKSIAGRSIAGRSLAGKSIAGKSIAASGIAPTERTFRTHMTTRELLVGGSEMREIMRSVSPISEPGVQLKLRKGRRNKKSLTREQTPLVSTTRVSASPTPAVKKKVKKDKKEKKDKKHKKAKAGKARPTQSPSHFFQASETHASVTPGAAASTAPSGPSHWKAGQEPSETPERPRAAKPKRAALRPARVAVSPPGDAGHKKKRKGKTELVARGDRKQK